MKYRSKRLKKIISMMKDENIEKPYKRLDNYLRRRETLYSRGGSLERSSTKTVGDIMNKNIDKRYNAANEAMKRIDNMRRS